MESGIDGHLHEVNRIDGLRVLVTGGAGFLGQRLVRPLVQVGAEVTIVDLPEALSVIHSVESLNVTILSHSLLDFDALSETVKNKDVIIHLAAISDVVHSMKNPRDAFLVNDLGTQNILEAIRRSNGDPHFVLSSSFTLYKSPPEYIPIDEEHPVWPGTPYAFTKACQDEMTSVYGEIYGLHEVRLRLAPLFGPGQRTNNILLFMLKALRNESITIEGGEQTRDWNFVDNVVYAILKAIAKKSRGAFNIGGITDISVRALAQKIIELTGSSSEIITKPYRPGESSQTRVLLDTRKSEEQLDYRLLISFEEGLKLLHNYAKSI